jgi:hypothetical protein
MELTSCWARVGRGAAGWEVEEEEGPVGGLKGLVPREGEAEETEAERGPVGMGPPFAGPEGGTVVEI